MKSSINDEKLSAKLNPKDKDTMLSAIESALKWLDEQPSAGAAATGATSKRTKEDYERKVKELESICNPIMTSLYGSDDKNDSPNGCAPGGPAAPKSSFGQPKVEEVD